MEKLSEAECRAMVELRDVPDAVKAGADRVAVILTQSWCMDWRVMRRYLQRLDEPGLVLRWIEYDQEPLFAEILQLKEDVFQNRLIPYVRYYRGGELVNESNLVLFPGRFLAQFGGALHSD